MKASGKILLVDDDPDFLEMHKAVLANHGYEVFTAMSGQEGLERVRTEMPDLIILDLIMEKHDAGFSFSKTIKTDPLFKRIPILMVTSVAEATGYRFSLEEDGYWMKTDDFLDKPVMPAVLLDRVAKLLGQKEEQP
ncbi:MAG: response regulator [Candidatus Aminicenantes bacterium]|nr:response regulator [Candidatus Aminicenantes bacterium]